MLVCTETARVHKQLLGRTCMTGSHDDGASSRARAQARDFKRPQKLRQGP